MYLSVGLLSIWIIVADGNEVTYQVLDISDLTPYEEIPCPESCVSKMAEGFGLIKNILGSAMSNPPIPMSFCQNCVVVGLATFQDTSTCYMSPEKDVFDYHTDINTPDFYVNCTCDVNYNPSMTADEVNKGNVIVGECGKEKAQNKQMCNPIQCENSGEGETSVKFRVNLAKPVLHQVLRVDTREPNPDAFVFRFSVTMPDDSEPFFHEGLSDIDKSWKCSDETKVGVVCHLMSQFLLSCYDCLNKPDKTQSSQVTSVAFEYGKCAVSA